MSAIDFLSFLLCNKMKEIKWPKKNDTKFNKNLPNISLMNNLFKEKLHSEGLTLVQNNGSVQEVKHFHLHLVPKYNNSKKMDIEEVFKKLVD